MSTLKVGEIKHESFTGTTQLKLDSAGRLLVGTTTEGQASADDLTINSSGSTGITIRSGSSNDGNLFFSDATSGNGEYAGYIQYEHANDALRFGTVSAERLRIDSSGNVGIGTTSMVGKLNVQGSAGGVALQTTDATNSTFRISHPSAAVTLLSGGSSQHLALGTGFAEKMRIDSSGNVGIGTTTIGEKFTIGDGDLKFYNSNEANNHRTTFIEFQNSSNRITSESNFGSDGSSAYAAGYKFGTKNFNGSAFESLTPFVIQANGNVGIGTTSPNDKLVVNGAITQNNTSTNITSSQLFFNNDTSGGQYRVRFDSNNSTVGSISVGTSSTAYNTSSDYRLKENITTISDGITRLKTLIPRRFNWKSDSSTIVDGFIAHEVTAVPEAVTGTKDEVATEDSKEAKKGDPVYQQIDQSKLVPLLTAALQEAIGRIEALEAK